MGSTESLPDAAPQRSGGQTPQQMQAASRKRSPGVNDMRSSDRIRSRDKGGSEPQAF